MKRAFSKKNLWDKTPPSAKALLGSVLSLIPLPRLLGADFRRWYAFALEADRWGAEQIRDYQLMRLRRIVTLAYEKTPFYRVSFRNVGFEPGDLKTMEDFQRLPTIDKATLRAHGARMMTGSPDGPGVDLVTTGGTSGEPLRFYMHSSRHAPEFAHLTAAWSRVGYRPGDVMAVLRGRVIARPSDGLHHEYDPLLRNHYYSSFHMSPEQMRSCLLHLDRVRPKFIHAYPSSLFALARFSIATGMPFPKSVQAALVESEPVFTHQRELIQRRSGLRMLSAYGLSEKIILAAECEHSSDYHVLPTYGYCEVLDAHGKTVAAGQRGELTGTGFINEVMPFIRYRTGDDAVNSGPSCPACGRVHLLLTDIQPRRNQEFLVAGDNQTLISMTALNLHDNTLDGVLRYQFVQDQPGVAVLKLLPAGGGAKMDMDRIQRHFSAKLDGRIALQLQKVDEIPLTRVGKQPMILQRCPGFDDLVKGSVPTSVAGQAHNSKLKV